MTDQNTGVAPVNHRDRWKALAAIRHASYSMERGMIGPRMQIAASMALLVGAVIFTLELTARPELILFGFNVKGGVYVLPVVAALAVVMRYSAKPKTWQELLDSLLAAYDPVSKTDYENLQAGIRAQGWDHELVRAWCGNERDAIHALEKASKPRPESKFLNRQLKQESEDGIAR